MEPPSLPRLLVHNLVGWTGIVLATLWTFIGCWLALPFSRLDKTSHFRSWARWWGMKLCQYAGASIEVRGREHLDRWADGQGAIIVANHQSALDIPLVLAVCPDPVAFLSKIEVFSIPVIGPFIRSAQYVEIRRGDRASAGRALASAEEALRRGERLILFPEGTRSPDGRLLPFKRGVAVLASRTGVPIYPLVVEGTRLVLPKKTLVGRPGAVTVTFGAPFTLEPAGEDEESIRGANARLRRVLLDLLGRPPDDLALPQREASGP